MFSLFIYTQASLPNVQSETSLTIPFTLTSSHRRCDLVSCGGTLSFGRRVGTGMYPPSCPLHSPFLEKKIVAYNIQAHCNNCSV